MNKTNKIKINIDKNISINKKRDIIDNNLELKKLSKLKPNIGHIKTNNLFNLIKYNFLYILYQIKFIKTNMH